MYQHLESYIISQTKRVILRTSDMLNQQFPPTHSATAESFLLDYASYCHKLNCMCRNQPCSHIFDDQFKRHLMMTQLFYKMQDLKYKFRKRWKKLFRTLLNYQSVYLVVGALTKKIYSFLFLPLIHRSPQTWLWFL